MSQKCVCFKYKLKILFHFRHNLTQNCCKATRIFVGLFESKFNLCLRGRLLISVVSLDEDEEEEEVLCLIDLMMTDKQRATVSFVAKCVILSRFSFSCEKKKQ